MIRLGIIGTGGMAQAHANQFAAVEGVEIVAACDVELARAEAYAKKFSIEKAYDSAEDLLKQADVDAVSVVTPDSTHASLSILALEHGKHVLCEKPLATSYADALRMAEVARDSGKIHMVNFSYRNSSAIHTAAGWIREGRLGRIYHVEAHYLQSWLTSTDWGVWSETPAWLWRLSTAHGSKGVLGDLGVHILDFASYPVGEVASINCRLKTFDKAEGGKVGDYVLDANDTAIATLEFANGALGMVATTRLATGHRNSLWLTIHGDEGAVRIDLDSSYEMIETCRNASDGRTQPWERVYTGKTPNMWQRFATAIKTGEQDQPDFGRGAEVQKMLDACEASHLEQRTIQLADFQ